MIAAQRQFILDRISKVALSHKKTYSPVSSTYFQSIGKAAGTNAVDQAVARAMAIPGVVEAGWTEADVAAAVWAAQKESDRPKNFLKSDLLQILQKIKDQPFAWPFREPVDTKLVTHYLEIITNPIDLGTMEKRIRKSSTENGYYKTKQMLYDDLIRMVENCKTFNESDSSYYECAVSLERFLPTLFPDLA
jgi:histone acetyltransferase